MKGEREKESEKQRERGMKEEGKEREGIVKREVRTSAIDGFFMSRFLSVRLSELMFSVTVYLTIVSVPVFDSFSRAFDSVFGHDIFSLNFF